MPDEGKKKPVEKVRIQYSRPDNYNPRYVSGVYGGVTPGGDLLCHFFYDYVDVPAEESGPIIDGNLETDKLERKSRVEHEPNELVVRRDVRVGLIVPIHQVRVIAEWMLEKVKESSITIEKKPDDVPEEGD
jgi:hypothetical protein